MSWWNFTGGTSAAEVSFDPAPRWWYPGSSSMSAGYGSGVSTRVTRVQCFRKNCFARENACFCLHKRFVILNTKNGFISFNFVETDWWCQTAQLFRLNTVFKEVASWVAAEDVLTGGFYQKKSKNLTLTATGSFPNIFKVLSYCDLQYELESW